MGALRQWKLQNLVDLHANQRSGPFSRCKGAVSSAWLAARAVTSGRHWLVGFEMGGSMLDISHRAGQR